MTTVNTASARDDAFPDANTAVLADRQLNPKRTHPLSVFADDWWDISHGLFEAHIPYTKLNFAPLPDRFREAAKHYTWQLINNDDPIQRRSNGGRRLAQRSIALALPRIAAFLLWLDAHDIDRVADVTSADLDRYAADIAVLEATVSHRRSLLVEVRRLWSYRSLLPTDLRLPEAPPWADERVSDLVGGAHRSRENLTPRIASDTMEMLLMWCLRFVEDFADDIITGYAEVWRLQGRSSSVRNRRIGDTGNRTQIREALPALRDWLKQLKQAGEGLPSRLGPDGE
jgi:hypothetical protein